MSPCASKGSQFLAHIMVELRGILAGHSDDIFEAFITCLSLSCSIILTAQTVALQTISVIG